MSAKLFRVEFEVFGRVQGVFFRKYTRDKAKELTTRGWCRNTSHDTVQGILEGDREKIDKMKNWLEKTGSPDSKIEKVVFKETPITEYSFSDFEIRR